MNVSLERTKPCRQCGKPMPRERGVCPHCGEMTPWFRVRFLVGCASVVIALIGMLIMLIRALVMPPIP